MKFDVVIVGGGHGGAQVAVMLRTQKFMGSIAIIGDEPELPYERPPLSKEYFAGEKEFERIQLRPAKYWDEREVTMLLGKRVVSVDPAAHVVTTDGGETIGYGKLVWATGGAPRMLPIPGGDLPGVQGVRTKADADAMKAASETAGQIVVIGGGYIGLEAAAVARKLGLDVTLVEAAPRILGRVAAAETADMIRDLHRGHGVTVIEGVGIARITGTEAADGVDLADGRHLPADLVICGIGVAPETPLAEAAGLALDNGIAVDAQGRSSDPAIWAAGDCASFPTPDGRLRLESVGNAIDMAEAVAANMLGAARDYVPRPWFWSDQFEAKLQIAGLNIGYDRVVTRPGSVWYYRGGRLIAVDALNDPRAYMIGKRLIEAGRSPTPEALAEATDLKALL